MKKIIALLMSVILVVAMLTACSGTGNNKAKTGLAVVLTARSSKDAGEKDGLAQTDSTAVAVLVDQKGVIKNIAIDVIQTKINFSATGEIVTDAKEYFVSKGEQGANYGMKAASPIGKEWDEQVAALAKYVTGKTLDQVKGIALTENGKAADADLSSSVTITISPILNAIEKAVNNAQELGASANDKLGLGLTSTLGKGNKNAGDEDGQAQSYSHYGVVTLDSKGKITSSIIDSSQVNVKFNAEGVITSELNGPFQTKSEIGEAYGMKAASPIGKEWDEQAKAFADYIKGKTISEVTGIALNERGSATSADLTSSVTVGIADFLKVVDRAGATAK